MIGFDAARHVHLRRDHLALVALPCMLAAHQVVEAFVWWGLQGDVPAGIGHVATWIYLLFAFVVLPVFVPVAVFALEPASRNRTLLAGLIGVGAFVSAVLLVSMLVGPVTARLGHLHVSYGTGLHAGFLIVVAYVAATCGSLLFSSYRFLRVFGVVNLIAVAVLARLTIDGFASLWCAWAAVSAGAIALHLRARGPRSLVAAAT